MTDDNRKPLSDEERFRMIRELTYPAQPVITEDMVTLGLEALQNHGAINRDGVEACLCAAIPGLVVWRDETALTK